MHWNPNSRVLRAGALALLTVLAATAHGHGGHAGEVVVTHPFATPTPPGAANGAAYFVRVENTGRQPDRLVRASTPVAQRVEFHTMTVDAAGVVRMRQVPDIPLAPGVPVRMRPGVGLHIMLLGLAAPLKEGDQFPLALEFAHGGTTEVTVVVQRPRARTGEEASHPH